MVVGWAPWWTGQTERTTFLTVGGWRSSKSALWAEPADSPVTCARRRSLILGIGLSLRKKVTSRSQALSPEGLRFSVAQQATRWSTLMNGAPA